MQVCVIAKSSTSLGGGFICIRVYIYSWWNENVIDK